MKRIQEKEQRILEILITKGEETKLATQVSFNLNNNLI